jgi:hypothetical protein
MQINTSWYLNILNVSSSHKTLYSIRFEMIIYLVCKFFMFFFIWVFQLIIIIIILC